MNEALLFNGEPGEPALAFHRGFTYGDGVFRTCLIHDAAVVDLEAQVARVLADAAVLDLAGPARSSSRVTPRRWRAVRPLAC